MIKISKIIPKIPHKVCCLYKIKIFLSYFNALDRGDCLKHNVQVSISFLMLILLSYIVKAQEFFY